MIVRMLASKSLSRRDRKSRQTLEHLARTAVAIANALQFAATTPVRDHARVLGETMRAENGVSDAVAVLEHIVAG
jgi:hypothetical protein